MFTNPSCIDNFYNNKKTTFFNSSTVKAGIFNHHSLIFIMLRATLCKGPSKFTYYRSYKNFNKEEFENVLKQRLVSSSNFKECFDTLMAILNEYAPLKKRSI